MKTRFKTLLIATVLLSVAHQLAAQGSPPQAQFFRIWGQAATTITALGPDGGLAWSNSQPGATITIQRCASLAGGDQWVNYLQIANAGSVGTNLLPGLNPTSGMALIPAGAFTMGDTLDGETDAVPVNVTNSAFYMDTNLVSLSEWQSVYFYAINSGYGFTTEAGAGKAGNQPVEMVDWYDSVKWCNARSQQAGLTPVYYTDADLTQVYTNGETTNVFANWGANGYRLPTEAEWEKAARGGVGGQRFPLGNTIDWNQANFYSLWFNNHHVLSYDLAPLIGSGHIGLYGFYDPAFDGQVPYTSPVGSFAANGYGLYDMAGNVQEWCWDWYGTPYAGGMDPHGPAIGTSRVLRGGLWFQVASLCRCANRSQVSPVNEDNGTGFRCVMVP